MLSTQVAYWQYKESQKHNRVTEAETERHNRATEDESVRHNKQTEALGWSTLYEQQYHNRRTEELQREYNMNYFALQNKVLFETQQHNRAVEFIQQQQADIARINSQTQARAASYAYENMQHQWALGAEANQIAWQNARINAFRAESQAKIGYVNAFTNLQQVNIAQQRLNLEQQKFRFDVWNASYHNVLDSVRAGADVIGAFSNVVRSINTYTGAGRNIPLGKKSLSN